MAELKITAANFENEVLRSDKPVLLDFYADWCGPCKMLSPVLHELAEEKSGTLKVGKVNVDEQMELAMRFQVSSVCSSTAACEFLFHLTKNPTAQLHHRNYAVKP